MVRRQAADVRIVREDLAAIWQRQSWAGSGEAGDDLGPHWTAGCPYRGLLPFDQAHAGLFCGRQRLTTELVVKLAARLAGPGHGRRLRRVWRGQVIPAARGPAARAGGGRSAGRVGPLAPRGHDADRRPADRTGHPPAALSGDDAAAIRRGLAADPEQAHVAVARAGLADAGRRAAGGLGPPGRRRLVLVVDQFEEVFTLAPGRTDSGQQAFIAALCAAATRPSAPRGDPAGVVVIAVRGDYWARCAADAGLARMMQDGLFVVGPMTGQELRQAITGPAAAAGLAHRREPGRHDPVRPERGGP